MATTQDLLTAAEDAYHRLMIGEQVVEVRDENGQLIRYNAASAPRLLAYIQSLKDLLDPCTRINGPMRVFF